MAVGQISGQLLSKNLLRDGVDLSFETDLLYLDVNTNRIGIKTDSPSVLLNIDNTIRTTNIISDLIDVANISLSDSTITTSVGPLYFSPQGSNPYINFANLQTDDLEFNTNSISSKLTNSDIHLYPAAGRQVKINGNANVYGSVHSTGNITFEGSIILGNDDTDSVSFASDIKSNIVPDVDALYDLGSPTKRWGHIRAKNVNATTLFADNFVLEGIDTTLRQGNIYYVATTGNDDNSGTHQNDPFLTIEKALSIATTGDHVQIYPGDYVETFPLTVPVGVTVRGAGIRSVSISPTLATNTNDAFLLNGETTVEDLTVTNFEYNSIADTGYGFRFANNFTVTSRSPYIKNITVITSGSTAGRGALADGSVANASSIEATMLFHAVTFITPNSIALMMTNGVRIEWLNSFTYFATKGLYATNGTLGFASLGTRFGAEIRSIGSANVYGLVGAEADGADTLMYLIQHNFGYIGSGLDSSNDKTLIVQENETVRLNSGKIYYVSQDQEGDFRVGDVFHADYQTGLTSFDTTGINISGFSSLLLSNGNDSTYINASTLDTGNLRITNNTLLSLTGDLNLYSAGNEINFLENVNVTKNLDVVGNFNLDGQLIFGNQASDTLQFNTTFDQDLNPKDNLVHNLGSLTNNLVWKTTFLSEAVIDTININANVITAGTDQDLVFLGTDHVLVEQLTIRNNAISNEVVGASTNLAKSIVLNPAGTGNIVISGTGAFKLPVGNYGNLNSSAFGHLRYNTDYASVEGYYWGRIRFFDLQSDNGLTKITAELTRGANDNTIRYYVNNSVVADLNATRFRADRFRVSNNIDFNLNQISTLNTNSNLSLVPNGTGVVVIGNLNIIANSIANTVEAVTLIQPTGTGYVEFGGTGALQIPAGTTLEQPDNPIIGATRWNTTKKYMEVYGPTGWQGATGSGAEINADAMDEITSLWAIVLG